MGWTLSGFGFLALAYFGAKFVLEDLLGRHWGWTARANAAPLPRFIVRRIGGLLILAAFFAGSETALMSLNRYRLRHRAKGGIAARGWRRRCLRIRTD